MSRFKGISKKYSRQERINNNYEHEHKKKLKVVKPDNETKTRTTKKPLKKNDKNLNNQAKCPDYIKCQNKVVFNHAKTHQHVNGIENATIFHNELHSHFINIMNTYGKNKTIVGCIAWLTNNELIDALSLAKRVAIIVNDEDYSTWGFGTVTKEKYQKLPAFNRRFESVWGDKIETPLNMLDHVYEQVRCFGSGKMMNSILHTKTLVICDDNDIPRWTWMGSMNFTSNSTNNIENAIFIDNQQIALSCFFNFSNIFIQSKPLRFSSN